MLLADEVRPPLTESNDSGKLSARPFLQPAPASVLPSNTNNNKRSSRLSEPLMTSIASLVAQLQGEISARDKPQAAHAQTTEAPAIRVSSATPDVTPSVAQQNMAREVQDWQERWKEERRIHAKLKGK